MSLPFYNWSRNAPSNATADSTAPWPEGMAPSAVNDSARAMMASTAAFRDDIAGAIVTGGSSTAYTVTSYQIFDTLAHLGGQVIAFTPHTTNTGNCTLNVDGLGVKAIRSSPLVDLPSGALIQGTPYVVTYNNATGVFLLQGGLDDPYGIPIGGGLDYWGATAPNSSFAFPSGQAISRTSYPTLFSLVGTLYGVGDGSTTYNLPDKRGRVSAGVDTMGGSGAGRLTTTSGMNGTGPGAVGGAETHTLSSAEMPQHSHTGTTGAMNSNQSHAHSTPTGADPTTYAPNAGVHSGATNSGTTGSTNIDHTHNFTTDVSGSSLAHSIIQPTIACNYIMRII